MTKRRDPKAADDAKTILNRVRQLVRLLRLFEREAQSRYGIGAAQMFILHVLEHEDDLSLGMLADRTATDQSSASLAVGRLVEDGYIRRTQSAQDRRQVRLSLTARGRAVVRRSPPAAQERIIESVRRMPANGRARLVSLLDSLIAGLGEEGAERAPMLFLDAPEERSPARRQRVRAAHPRK